MGSPQERMSPMNDSDPVQHLLTRYVFIDTEAFRKARFDWTGRMLSKLVEFANLLIQEMP